ncbi:MAG: hypothetical protein ACEQSC_00065 [Candidatus Nanopelagicaceae bacterium]
MTEEPHKSEKPLVPAEVLQEARQKNNYPYSNMNRLKMWEKLKKDRKLGNGERVLVALKDSCGANFTHLYFRWKMGVGMCLRFGERPGIARKSTK